MEKVRNHPAPLSPNRKRILVICAAAALIGTLLTTASDLIGIWLIRDHDPLGETISELASGNRGWLRDSGIKAYAGATLALAIGFTTLWIGRSRGWLPGALLLVQSVSLVAVAHYDLPIRADAGLNRHHAAVLIYYSAFCLSAVLLAFFLRPLGRRWFWWSLLPGIAWLVLGPVLLAWIPETVQGLAERALAIVLGVWTLAMAAFLHRQTRSEEVNTVEETQDACLPRNRITTQNRPWCKAVSR